MVPNLGERGGWDGGAQAVGLMSLVLCRWWEGWWGQFWGQVAQAEKQDRPLGQRWGSDPLPHLTTTKSSSLK